MAQLMTRGRHLPSRLGETCANSSYLSRLIWPQGTIISPNLHDVSPTLIMTGTTKTKPSLALWAPILTTHFLPCQIVSLSYFPSSYTLYLLISPFVEHAPSSDDSATFLMVRFPGNLKQVLTPSPRLAPKPAPLAQFCENGRGGGGANQSDVSVGGRSNAVVYARVGLSLHRDHEV